MSINLRASHLIYLICQSSFEASLVVSLEHPIHLSFSKLLFNFVPEEGVRDHVSPKVDQELLLVF